MYVILYRYIHLCIHYLLIYIYNISHIFDHLKVGYLKLLIFDPTFSLDILGSKCLLTKADMIQSYGETSLSNNKASFLLTGISCAIPIRYSTTVPPNFNLYT